MFKIEKHRIKSTLLKIMAITITFCYLMEPAQKELRHVLHFISHNLQAPSYVLQHDISANYKDSTKSQNSLSNHDHQILDFIDKIIDSSGDSHEHHGTSTADNFTIKKIVVHYEYAIEKNSFSFGFKKDNFKIIRCQNHQGHVLHLFRPPQRLFTV